MAVNPVIDINKNLSMMVTLLGSKGVYTPVNSTVVPDVAGLISPFDRRDVDLIQSYGVGGCRLTFMASAFTARPKKFDQWVCAGRKYIFDNIADIIVKGEIIGYTAYVKGIIG